MPGLFIGTAGWSIPRASAAQAAGDGTHLQRYARVFRCAEINSSFHRPHAPATYERWAAATPAGFRFAVKLPKLITHELRLQRGRAPLVQFLEESAGLGPKRGPLLVQLPPSFAFDARVAGRFFALVRSLYAGPLVCEPRHATWLGAGEALLARYHVARVGADPEPAPGAGAPGGWPGLIYLRLHGSPRKYWSSYTGSALDAAAGTLREASCDAWCVFDNTASGAAFDNALQLESLMTGRRPPDARADSGNRGDHVTDAGPGEEMT